MLLAKFGVDTAENEPLKVLLIIQPWDLLFTEPPRPTAPFVRPGRLRLPLCSAGDGHIGFATALDFLPKSNVRFKAQTLSECGAHRKKIGWNNVGPFSAREDSPEKTTCIMV